MNLRPDLPPPFAEYEVEGIGTVIDPMGETDYRVRTADGRVIGFAAASGAPSEANALADITSAIAAHSTPVTPVPASVSPRQIRRALSASGLRGTVESAVASGPQDLRDDWEFALEVRRDWPALNVMATALGLTSVQVDDLFRLASAY